MGEQDPRTLKRTRGGRERLLDAAAELFGTHSLAGTSLQMIADRLGVSKPAIYHHFRSREDIVLSLMGPVVSDTRQALDELATLRPAERAAAARTFYAGFVVTHRKIINMVFFDRGALPGDLADTIDSLVDEVAAALAGSPRPAADPDTLALTTTLVYGVAALVTRSQHLDDEALHVTVAGVLARAGAPARASATP